MPAKMDMFMTFTNRTAMHLVQPKPAIQKPAQALRQSSTPHTMRSIMHAPRNGCSSCGH
jgi:hypothetical protein